MAHNKLYRNFIILQEDERGYSASKDKALSGYAKVEAKGDKCKISFYAQNLNPEYRYSMVLICCKRDSKQLIDLGPLTINEVGKGDTSKEYYINNIAGLGISYEKISGAAICRIKGEETGFIMYGFMNGEESTENWRRFKLVKVVDKRSDNKADLNVKNIKVTNVNTKTINKPIVEETKKLETKKEDIPKVESNLKEKTEPKIQVNTIEEIKTKTSKEEAKEEVKEEVKDKVNIDVEVLDREAKIEDNQLEFIEENRKKDKCKDKDEYEECKKYKEKYKEYKEKYEDCKKYKEKYEEYKEEKEEKNDSIEEYIKKLAEKLEDYEGKIDFEIDLEGDFMVYGIIKNTSQYGCKWKKFKMNKHCYPKFYSSIKRQDNSRRIEENTRIDSLNFEQYENEIQNIKKSNDFSIKGKTGEYFENLAKDFESYNEKLNDINYCKWYKVDVNSIEDLCNQSNYNKYTLAYYPMLNYYPYINKSNYFLLGYKCNKEGELQYIVYGIPGSKDKDDQPFGGKTGFVTWTNDDTRNQGYWLMFYDYKNCSIVVPMK